MPSIKHLKKYHDLTLTETTDNYFVNLTQDRNIKYPALGYLKAISLAPSRPTRYISLFLTLI